MIEPWQYQVVAGLLFMIGVLGVLIRRNVIVMAMCIDQAATYVDLQIQQTVLPENGHIGSHPVAGGHIEARQIRAGIICRRFYGVRSQLRAR